MGLFSGIMDILSGGSRSDASASYSGAVSALSGLIPPTAEETAVSLERMVLAGTLTPAQAQAQLQEATRLAGIQTNPQLAAAQLNALTELQRVSQEGGLTSIDRSKLNAIQTDEQTAERGQREALLQNAQQRGVAGSGLELAAQLSNEQNAANRASARGTEVAAQAQERALRAIQNAGELSGQLRDQDFAEQSSKAKAQDAINAFNTNMRQQAEIANTSSANTAQNQNLANQMKVQELNLGQQKAEQLAAAESANTQYQSQIDLAKARAGALQSQGASQATQGKDTLSGVTGAIGNIASNWDTYSKLGSTVAGWFSDENLKKERKELTSDEIGDMLNNLTGYSYKYKGSNEPGVGVMAQDLENTPLSDNVVDTPKGKMVVSDPTMQSAMLAALANLNKRLNDIEG